LLLPNGLFPAPVLPNMEPPALGAALLPKMLPAAPVPLEALLLLVAPPKGLLLCVAPESLMPVLAAVLFPKMLPPLAGGFVVLVLPKMLPELVPAGALAGGLVVLVLPKMLPPLPVLADAFPKILLAAG